MFATTQESFLEPNIGPSKHFQEHKSVNTIKANMFTGKHFQESKTSNAIKANKHDLFAFRFHMDLKLA